MKVELSSLVHQDLLEAVDYYFHLDETSLASDFYSEFLRCVAQAVIRPESYPIYIRDFRRVNLKRFPYHFLYRVVDQDRMRIIVVKHDHRDPRFGLGRD